MAIYYNAHLDWFRDGRAVRIYPLSRLATLLRLDFRLIDFQHPGVGADGVFERLVIGLGHVGGAVFTEAAAGVGEQSHRVEEVVNDDRLEDVQLEVAL